MVKTRAVKGSGTIYKEPNGNYRGVIHLGGGKRKTFSGDSRPIVKKRMDDWREANKSNSVKPKTSTRFYEYSNRWLELKKKKKEIKTSTYQGYLDILKIHFKPVFAPLNIEDIKVKDVNNYFAKKMESKVSSEGEEIKGLSPSSLAKHRVVLHSICSMAVAEDILPRNIIESTMTLQRPYKKVESLSKEELQKLLDGAQVYDEKIRKWGRKSNMFLLILLAALTGARRGELLALRKENIRFTPEGTAKLSFKENLIEINGTKELTTPKTHQSSRVVTLMASGTEILKKHLETDLEMDYIFTTSNNTLYSPTNISRTYRELAKKAGVNKSFHVLRHTHATLLLESGVDIKIVSSRLGHSDIGVTSKFYIGDTSHQDELAADLLERIVKV